MIKCIQCEREGDMWDAWYCEECGNNFIKQQLNNKKLITNFNKLFDSFWVKIKSHQYYDPFPLEKIREEYKKIKEELKKWS